MIEAQRYTVYYAVVSFQFANETRFIKGWGDASRPVYEPTAMATWIDSECWDSNVLLVDVCKCAVPEHEICSCPGKRAHG